LRAFPASDWWSLGVLLYELLAGQYQTPFHVADNPVETMRRVLNMEGLSFPPFFSVHSMHLIGRLLCKEPLNRLGHSGMDEVTSHEFFAGTDWKATHAGMGPQPVGERITTYDIRAAVARMDAPPEEPPQEGTLNGGTGPPATSPSSHRQGSAWEMGTDTLGMLSAHEHCYRRTKWVMSMRCRHPHVQLNSSSLLDQLSRRGGDRRIKGVNSVKGHRGRGEGGEAIGNADLAGVRSTITAKVETAQLQEFRRVFREVVRPTAQCQGGYKASRYVVDEKAGLASPRHTTVIVIMSWASERAMHDVECNGWVDQTLQALAPFTISLTMGSPNGKAQHAG